MNPEAEKRYDRTKQLLGEKAIEIGLNGSRAAADELNELLSLDLNEAELSVIKSAFFGIWMNGAAVAFGLYPNIELNNKESKE